VWRKAERRPGCRANGAAPPVEANARPPPERQGERQERQRVNLKTPHPQGARSAGKRASQENPAHFQRSVRSALAPAIITVRPRRHKRLGGASPRRRGCGIERDAGLHAGAKPLDQGHTPETWSAERSKQRRGVTDQRGEGQKDFEIKDGDVTTPYSTTFCNILI
jgi:hypothetical protein